MSILEGHEKFMCAALGPMPFTTAPAQAAVFLCISAGFTSYLVAGFPYHCALLVLKVLKEKSAEFQFWGSPGFDTVFLNLKN